MTQHFSVSSPSMTDELAAVGVASIVGTLSQIHWMLGQLCQQNRINIPQTFQAPAGLQAGAGGLPWGAPMQAYQPANVYVEGRTGQQTEQGATPQTSTTLQAGQGVTQQPSTTLQAGPGGEEQTQKGRRATGGKRRRGGESVNPAKRAAGIKGAAARAAKRQAQGAH